MMPGNPAPVPDTGFHVGGPLHGKHAAHPDGATCVEVPVRAPGELWGPVEDEGPIGYVSFEIRRYLRETFVPCWAAAPVDIWRFDGDGPPDRLIWPLLLEFRA